MKRKAAAMEAAEQEAANAGHRPTPAKSASLKKAEARLAAEHTALMEGKVKDVEAVLDHHRKSLEETEGVLASLPTKGKGSPNPKPNPNPSLPTKGKGRKAKEGKKMRLEMEASMEQQGQIIEAKDAWKKALGDVATLLKKKEKVYGPHNIRNRIRTRESEP